MSHIPVLLDQVLEYANPKKVERLVDGTVGDGGYVKEILKANPEMKVLGIDLDQTSLDKLGKEFARGNLASKVRLVSGNFKDIKHIVKEHSFDPVSVVILDIGFSSSQIDEPSRGLSFQQSGPLDMRFDQSQGKTAEQIVNSYSPEKLTAIFRDYGEERLASKIAREIIQVRAKEKITDTKQLFEIIRQSLPKPVAYKASDFARRIFQALRIEVNDELNNLRKALPDILEILEPGGRMIIVSFHSLEDRIVKEFMVEAAKGCICPPDFPTCVCGKNPLMRILTKKPLIATEAEVSLNSRAKAAKMRVAQKI